MSQDYEDQLRELDEKWRQAQISELEYKEAKWRLLQEMCARGSLLSQDYYLTENQEVTDSNGVEYCYLGTGPFVFGPDDEYCELKAPILIAKYPVTVQQFLTFVEDSGYDYPAADIEQLKLVSPQPDCPVSHVSWVDAKEYCRWLRKINCEYYSLPHEIEWERAARGVDGRFYPWGNEDPTPDRACYRDPVVHDSTRPIGAYPENLSPNGCIGMVGNVWEWCLDTVKDPRDPHILRGGSWCNPVEHSSTVSRTFAFPPGKRIDYGGFRVVYLPNDMLIEYRRQYASGVTSKSDLTVVTHAKRKKRLGEESTPGLPAIPPAKGAAAAAAAAPPSGVELNDLMAEAISEAAELYRRSLQRDEAGAQPSAQPPEPAAPALPPVEEKGRKKPKRRKNQEAEAEDPKAALEIPMADLPDDKARSGGEPVRPMFSGDPRGNPKLTIAALVLWAALFLGVIALFLRKLLLMS